jgi:drug/metabolite transporter (DMT)-like permease
MAVIWGIPYLLIRVAVAEVSPPVLVFARTAIGTAVLLPLAITRVDLRPTVQHFRWVVAFAAVEIAGPWVLLGWAEQRVTSSLAGLLAAGVPIVGMIIAVVTGSARQDVTRTSLFGILLGIIGVAAIAGGNLNAENALAVAAIGLVAVGYATGPWILAHKLEGVPSLGVMAPSLAMAAMLYLPFSLLTWPSAMPSPGALASIAILGLVCTALAFVLFAELVGEVGPVRVTVITYLNPAVAATLGALVLAEPFTLPMAVGFVLVIAGSVLVSRRSTGTTPVVEAEVAPA